MKAVFLDFGTMGPGLDVAGLENVVDELVVYDDTEDGKVAERIADADLVMGKERGSPSDSNGEADRPRHLDDGLRLARTHLVDRGSLEETRIRSSSTRRPARRLRGARGFARVP